MTESTEMTENSETSNHNPPELTTFLTFLEDGDPTVYIKNKEAVRQKITDIALHGSRHLHIISDFDMTLTKYWVNGKRSTSSHGVLEQFSKMTPECKEYLDALFKKYYPIEVSHTIPYEEKFKAMVEWWTFGHEKILEMGLTRQNLCEMAKETSVSFRPGLSAFLELCRDQEIPLLIFSAGLGDVIEQILLSSKLFYENAHIVSNRMKFDETGKCIAFEEPLIHVFNKNEAAIKNMPYYERIHDRKHVILMGDSLGDVRMGDGVSAETKLTIGYLNHDKDLLLDQYADTFDIVILDDAPMFFINTMLKMISSIQR